MHKRIFALKQPIISLIEEVAGCQQVKITVWLVSIDYERLFFLIHSFKVTVYAINFSTILYFI